VNRAAYLRKSHPDWITVPILIVDCVSVAIAFIPEGLPIALTASLTITANLMRKNKILCKSLKTVETLGAVSVICSDKTGTLTKARITIRYYNGVPLMFPLEQNVRHGMRYRYPQHEP
jgi:sodium/potassium-transporting ATPase subunit alpha